MSVCLIKQLRCHIDVQCMCVLVNQLEKYLSPEELKYVQTCVLLPKRTVNPFVKDRRVSADLFIADADQTTALLPAMKQV